MTKKELKDLLIENFVDEDGDIDMSGLDFSEFEGDIIISKMKVKRNLYQNKQKVGGDLHQEWNEVGYDLHQEGQKVEGYLYQGHQKVKGDLKQCSQEVGGVLLQGNQEVGGNLHQHFQEVGGDLWQFGQKVKGYVRVGADNFAGIKEWKERKFKITKELDPYKDMSREELINRLKEKE